MEGSALVVVDVLPTGEGFGGRPIGLYGIIGIGPGTGAVLIALLP
jgi:hypothetical protein